MEKFRIVYEPQNLFKVRSITAINSGKVKFAVIQTTSDLYKRRQIALGITIAKRGRKSSASKKINAVRNSSDSDNSEQRSTSKRRSPRRGTRTNTQRKETTTKSNEKKVVNTRRKETTTKSNEKKLVISSDDENDDSSEWEEYNMEAV
jgi:hypothetical protein